MNYNEGDLVVLKSKLKVGNVYGMMEATDVIKSFSGKAVIITRVSNCDYSFEGYDFLTDEMIDRKLTDELNDYISGNENGPNLWRPELPYSNYIQGVNNWDKANWVRDHYINKSVKVNNITNTINIDINGIPYLDDLMLMAKTSVGVSEESSVLKTPQRLVLLKSNTKTIEKVKKTPRPNIRKINKLKIK